MNDERDNTNERLEGLLRRWGAQEAANRSTPGAFVPGRQASISPRGSGGLWRWAPAMAAAVLLAAAAGVYHLALETKARDVAVTPARPEPAQTAPAESAELARLRAELAAEKATARESAKALEDKSKALTDAAMAAEAGKAELAAAGKRVEEAQAALEEARRQGGQVQERLTAAEAEKTKIEDQLKQARGAGEVAAAKLKRVQQALVDETAQLRQMHADAVAGEAKARAELQRGRVSQAIVVAGARKAYLEAASPAKHGAGRVEVMQAAARARRMLDRRPDAADIPRAGKLREAVSVIEDLFTRLDLVDANNPGECRKYLDVLRDRHVADQVEQALPLTDSEPLRGWLVEANLILGGADNAG